MLTILNQQASVANQFLMELRDNTMQKNRERFRKNIERLGELMAYEISKKLTFQTAIIQTPLASTEVKVLKEKPVLITVLREGLAYFQGFQNYFGESDCGFIGAYRKEGETDLSINLDYMAIPDLTGRVILLVDPMLATGLSFHKAVNALIQRGGMPSFIHIAALVSAPEGVKFLHENLNVPNHIWTWALDERLNDHHYIVPGLGDAGDLSYGDKI
jgi:uracil phosphoribosyltransferase